MQGLGSRCVAVAGLVVVLAHFGSCLPLVQPKSSEQKLNTVIRMSNEFMKHGRLQEARSLLKTNLRCCFPDDFSLLEQYGLALHHLGHQQAAIKKYKQALAAHPSHAGVAGLLSNLALSQEEIGDDGHALKNYKTALKLDPNLKGAHVNIANYYRIHRQWDQAAANLKKAVEIDPRDHIAVGGLGAVYMDQHKWKAAKKQFERALEINPDSWPARTELGNVLLRMDKDQAAKRAFEQVLAKNPSWYRAHDGLAAFYIKHHQKKLAQKEARAALALRSGDQYSLDLLSQAKHSSREAERHFNAVVTYSDQYDHITATHRPHPEYAQPPSSSFQLSTALIFGALVAVLGAGIWLVYSGGKKGPEGYQPVRSEAGYETGFESSNLLDEGPDDEDAQTFAMAK